MKLFSYPLWVVIIVLWCTMQVAFSQNHAQAIRGTVVDKTSKYPLIGANIIVVGSNPLVGAVADFNGNFTLSAVPIGRVTLKVSYVGYNDALLANLELNTGKELVLTIELEEKVYQGAEVVISAQRDKTEPINKMASVSAREFTVEESNMYAGARSDVARMAANFAGVNGTEDSRNDVIIRGNTPSGLLWRLDDVDIPNPNHFAAMGTTGGPISILRNNLLLNSDFLTGAFPAEYGNALAGVFDLKSISGNNQHHEFLAQVAFNGIEVAAEGPLSRKKGYSYLIDYRYSTLDVFSKLGIQMGTGQAVPKYQDIFFKLNFPNTKIGSISLFGFGGMSHIAFLDSKKDTTKQKIDFYGTEGWDLTNYSNQAMVALSDLYLINKSTYLKFTLATTFHNFYTYKDSVTPATLNTIAYQRSNDLECRMFLSFYYNHKFNAHHNLKAGLNAMLFYYDILDTIYTTAGAAFLRKNDYRGYSVLYQPYIQWQYKISEPLILNVGLHGQYYDYSKAYSVEPRLGFKWSPFALHTFSLGFGMHSQMIPVTVFFNQLKRSDGSYIMTNNHLDFTRSMHLVFAYDWTINENTRLKFEAYYQYLYNIPIDKMDTNSYSLLNEGANFEVNAHDYLTNKGTGNNYGVELTVERFLSRGFYYLGTASLYTSKYKGSDGECRHTAFSGGYNINLLAGKEFNLKFRKKKPEKRKKTFTVNLKTTFNGGQRYTPIDEEQSLLTQKNIYVDELAWSKKFPDYMRTDLKLAYKMNGKHITIEWSLEITNLFNQKNVFNQTFNRKTGDTYFTYQLGRMIIPQYRIIF
ncbi:MAG: TonB-dependent receptor [Bacteroidota bacterium]